MSFLPLRHFSIRQRMNFLATYLFVVFGLFFILFLYERTSYQNELRIASISQSLHISLLNLRRREKDFMATKDPDYVRLFEVESDKMAQILDTWTLTLQNLNYSENDSLLLREAMLMYRFNMLNYVEYRRQLGFDNTSGLAAELGQLQQKLAGSLRSDQISQKYQLDSFYKIGQQFINQPDVDLLALFEQTYKALLVGLNQEQSRLAQEYHETFSKAAKVAELMGYTGSEGSHGLLRKAAHLMEYRFVELSKEANAYAEHHYKQRVIFILSLALLLFAFTAVALLALSKSIAQPLVQLKQDVEHLRLGQRNLVFEQESDEIGRIFSSLRQFQNDLSNLDELRQREQEQQVLLLSEKNKLEQALLTLKSAQNQLLQSEKLASLGSLVAGVAHEINTPLGIALTMGSTFSDHLREFFKHMQAGQLKRSYVESFQSDAEQGLQVMQTSLQRAADLINNFKQVAVDQASEERRKFNLLETINSVLQTMYHLTKRRHIEVTTEILETIYLNSYPGPFGQVITNLISNTLLHAFTEEQSGTICIKAITGPENVSIYFDDNGAGIPAKNLARIFEPFFTTKLGQGGSGLGLNIVYNIVTGVLAGQISVQSEPGKGTRFHLVLPIDLQEKEKLNE